MEAVEAFHIAELYGSCRPRRLGEQKRPVFPAVVTIDPLETDSKLDWNPTGNGF